jgi:site-specific DNA-methyltransferase (adenine-specific)
VTEVLQDLPPADNAAGAVEKMLRANAIWRNVPWPPPFDETQHRVHEGDARKLSFISTESVHLVVTSPPYWTLKECQPHQDQLGAITDYERSLTELDKVLQECVRVLVPGGRICCVVGDIEKGIRHPSRLHCPNV